MKKLIITIASLGMIISSSFAQGYFNFDNSADFGGSSSLLPTLNSGAIGGGNPGQVIGSDFTFATPNYDITYFWLLGTAHSGQWMEPYDFVALGAQQGDTTFFNGPTGDTADGAGIVQDGYQVPSSTGLPDGTLITVQIFTWYDPTGSFVLPSHDAYGNWSANVGWSTPTTVRLATAGDPNVVDIRNMTGISFGDPIPEPSIFTLSGLTAALMWVRRKQLYKRVA